MNNKITAIGEILFDVYPGYKKLGGAPFNFLYHVWKLTGNGTFISKIGDDEEGEEIIKLLGNQEFDTSKIQIDYEYPTGIVNVELNENKIPTFEIVENRAWDFIEFNEEIKNGVVNSDLLYFGSLAQRNNRSRKTIQECVELNTKKFCDLNIRQNFYTEEIIRFSLNKSSVVKLNSDELELVYKLDFNKDSEIEETAKLILDKYNIDLLCVTLGEEGALLFNNKEVSHHKEKVKTIIDTVGAGDAYAAMLAIGFLNDWHLEQTNKIASEFSAAICEVKGAIPFDDKLYNKFRDKIKNG